VEPWRVRLTGGDVDGAWELFLERYRPLIFATIRRTIADDASAHDVFADVCDALSANGLARLSRHHEGHEPKARFSTWLVTVVHHLVIDWLRKRDGRRRVSPPAELSAVQREIFRRVFEERRSHVEAYELVCAAVPDKLAFGAFLRELSATYRVVQRTTAGGVMRYVAGPPSTSEGGARSEDEVLAAAGVVDRLTRLMEPFSPAERLALQLCVIEELPAADVARTVGWPNAKAVYNRVYRLLGKLRDACERAGIRPTDL
jgi:RNA polymerase sigma factor (sigma-70 family)